MRLIKLCVITLFTLSSNCVLAQKLPNIKKIALVIGVANYENVGKLNNTLNDARDMGNALTNLGFDVQNLIDPTVKEMSIAIDSFGVKMSSADVCLFYYSGHGAEYNGENYLFPKNSNPVTPNDLPYEAVSVGKLIGKIDFSKVRTSIIILDACRSNPFTKKWGKDITHYQGLANINAPSGTFIGFAASPGKTASDGPRKNGIYTEAILKYISVSGNSIDKIFNLVNKEVRIQSNGDQIPFKSSSLEDDFYFSNGYFNEVNADKDGPNKIKPSNEKDNNLESNTTVIYYGATNEDKKKFPLPPIVKGYSISNISTYGTIDINKFKFNRTENILLDIKLKKNILDIATPFYVEIVKWTSPTGTLHIYTGQFSPITPISQINCVPKLESGTYELRIGFYLISELNTEYPPFYSRSFNIIIQ